MYNVKIQQLLTSGQDGGIGKCSLPPSTTTANLQLNYRTNVTHNCQKIELYGCLTTKELKKPHLSREVGEAGGGDMEMQNGLVLNPCVVDIK